MWSDWEAIEAAQHDVETELLERDVRRREREDRRRRLAEQPPLAKPVPELYVIPPWDPEPEPEPRPARPPVSTRRVLEIVGRMLGSPDAGDRDLAATLLREIRDASTTSRG